MRVFANKVVVALVSESAEEENVINELAAAKAGHVFQLSAKNPGECRFLDLGPRALACREPLNIVWNSLGDPKHRLISNLAPTPFRLHDQTFASVEAFWQGLKFEDASERLKIAGLSGHAAKLAGRCAPADAFVTYQGRRIEVGRPEHWSLMKAACWAKFDQNDDARSALLSTGDRRLTHKVKVDSRSIPGAIMADIWMDVREKLRRKGR